MLQFMGSQRVEYDMTEQLNTNNILWIIFKFCFSDGGLNKKSLDNIAMNLKLFYFPISIHIY